eukprot:scaffold1669_cov129-Cylindrotheca_fusiformis.AAC.47
MKTKPFDPPKLLTARRHIGFVDVPDLVVDGSLLDSPHPASGRSERSVSEDSMPGPTSLVRSQTMSGSILVVEDSDEPNQAFWLARKVRKDPNGVTRVGYRLRRNSKDELKTSNGNWELDINESCLQPLVTIKMLDTKVLDDSESGETNMMSFLQIIGNDGHEDRHVDGTNLVATCADHVYVILPYHRDGSLDEFCRTHGNLPESLARFFFRQILKVGRVRWAPDMTGIQTLQRHELCHRDLSLKSVALDGDHVSISQSRFPLRCKTVVNPEDDQVPPTPGGRNAQYIAPEYFRGALGAWDGFAADLWACGLMLYSMVVGCDALFLAPVEDDRTFVRLCMKGQVKSLASKYGELMGERIDLSDELVDLLQKMLKVDPSERISLEQIQKHLWVTNSELMTPKELSSTSKEP